MVLNLVRKTLSIGVTVRYIFPIDAERNRNEPEQMPKRAGGEERRSPPPSPVQLGTTVTENRHGSAGTGEDARVDARDDKLLALPARRKR